MEWLYWRLLATCGMNDVFRQQAMERDREMGEYRWIIRYYVEKLSVAGEKKTRESRNKIILFAVDIRNSGYYDWTE